MKTTRKYNPESETQIPEDGSFVEQVKKEAERIRAENERAQTELDLTPPSGVKTPENVRQKSRGKIVALLSAALIGTGAAGAGAYACINKKPATEQQKQKNEPVNNTVEKTRTERPEIPDEVRNNQDLQIALESQNIFADGADFDVPTEKPQLHAKALNLKLNPELDGASGPGYEWIPIRNRVTELDQKEIIIAVKVVNRYVTEDAQSLLHPKGFTYRARTVDPKDPSVTYFYYNCADKENPSMLAQIGLQDPTNPKKLLWARSFNIPACE